MKILGSCVYPWPRREFVGLIDNVRLRFFIGHGRILNYIFEAPAAIYDLIYSDQSDIEISSKLAFMYAVSCRNISRQGKQTLAKSLSLPSQIIETRINGNGERTRKGEKSPQVGNRKQDK